MNKLLFFCFLYISSLLCSNDTLLAQNPEKVYRLPYINMSTEWYNTQVGLWAKEIKNHPENENAWYNYYFAKRYATMGGDPAERKAILDSTIQNMSGAIPDSWVYYYTSYYNGDRDFRLLEKAYERNPERADLYYEFMHYYEERGNFNELKKFCEKLYESGDIIPGLYDYNFNILNTCERNSILFSNGDNDTYPVWVLQQVKGIRQDVTLMNTHTVFALRDYLKLKLRQMNMEINPESFSKDNIALFLQQLTGAIKKKYPGKEIYIAPTVYESYTKNIRNKLFLTGPGYLYSEKPVSLTLLQKNLEENLRLDYLDDDKGSKNHISVPILNRLNLNYVPSFLTLAKFYRESGEASKAAIWKNRAKKIAEKAEYKEYIKLIQDEFSD